MLIKERQTMPQTIILQTRTLCPKFQSWMISIIAAVVRMTWCSKVVHATRVIRSTIMVYSTSLIILGKELLHFPISLLRANAEFEVFLGDRVPVLVNGQPELTSLT